MDTRKAKALKSYPDNLLSKGSTKVAADGDTVFTNGRMAWSTPEVS